MVILRKMLIPVVRKYLRLFLSMMITASLAMALVISLWGVYVNLEKQFNAYLDDYGHPDVTLNILTAKTDISVLNEVEGVAAVNVRNRTDCSVVVDDRRLTTRLFTFNPETDFMKQYIWESVDESTLKNPGVYVERVYASKNNIQVGDELHLFYYNIEYVFNVAGLMSATETESVKQNNYIWGESPDFGYMYTNAKNDTLSQYGFYNQILIKGDGSISSEELRENILKVLPEKIRVLESFTFEESPVGISKDMNLTTLRSLLFVAPPLFFVITLLIVFLFMVQIMKQERKNVGIYKALGFENKDILPLFIGIAVIIGVLSVLLGIAIGYPVSIYMFRIYQNGFSLPPSGVLLSWRVVGIFGSINLAVCIISALFSAIPVFRVEPVEAMMTQTSGMREPKVFRHVKLPIAVKLTVSMVLRNLVRFIFSSICIASSVLLIIASLLYFQAGKSVVHQVFDTRMQYDALVYYNTKMSNAVKKKYDAAECVTDYQVLSIAFLEVEYNDQKESMTLFGMPDTSYFHIVDESGEKEQSLPDSGILLDYRLARALGAHTGDMVTIGDKKVQVAGISKQYINTLCYMSEEEFQKLDCNYIQAVACHITSKQEMIEFSSHTSGYASIEFVENLKNYTYSCFDNINLAVYILMGFSIIVGFIIIYNISQINLKECQKEIAVMKTLGVRQSYIRRSWFCESLFQYAIALLVGLPLGSLAGKFVLNNMESRVWIYPYIPLPVWYFTTAGITVAYVIVSHLISMGSIHRWNLADLTRSKE